MPCHREEDILEENVKIIEEYLQKVADDFEIILVEDHSGTPTAKKAEEIASKSEKIRHIHSDANGRGVSIEKAIRESTNKFTGYMDADLATDIEHIPEFIERLESGCDIVIGSRTEGNVDRKFRRKVPSIVFNRLVKNVLGSDIDDHQCGFKFFRKESVEKVLQDVKNQHFFWDAELLIFAQRKNLKICKVAVIWEEKGDSTVNIFLDSSKFFKEIIRLKKDLMIR